MKIDTFGVEMWMNEWENICDFNLAETCVESLTLKELLNVTGKNETDLDSEGWSEMDFCMDRNIGDDAVYGFFLFILLIPLVIYLLVSWRKHRYGHY